MFNTKIDLQTHAEIDREIVNAVIAATPEHWNCAAMYVERKEVAALEKMSIVISSPEGNREPISPTDEIYAALYKLSDLYRSAPKHWLSVIYNVSLMSDEQWNYTVDFSY